MKGVFQKIPVQLLFQTSTEIVYCLDEDIEPVEVIVKSNCEQPNLSFNSSGLPSGLNIETAIENNEIKIVLSGKPIEKGVFPVIFTING